MSRRSARFRHHLAVQRDATAANLRPGQKLAQTSGLSAGWRVFDRKSGRTPGHITRLKLDDGQHPIPAPFEHGLSLGCQVSRTDNSAPRGRPSSSWIRYGARGMPRFDPAQRRSSNGQHHGVDRMRAAALDGRRPQTGASGAIHDAAHRRPRLLT